MSRWLYKLLLCALLGHATLACSADDPRFSTVAIASALSAFEQTAKIGHPRLFRGGADHSGIVEAASAERAGGVKALSDYLHRTSVRVVDMSFISAAEPLNSPTNLKNWFKQERTLEGLAESAVSWYFTRDSWFLDELRARMAIFGPLVIDNQCHGELMQARAYAWYFALAYDFAYPALNAAERELARNVVKTCALSALPSALKNVKANPRDGIAFHALGKFIGALTIVLGELPEARGWLEPALQTYLATLSPWGGDDGGYANGSSYVLWDTGESLLIWDLIERALSLPIYQKAWVAQLPRFIAYTLPPGTPAGVFGDGAEVNRKEEWARFGKAIMSRYSTPLARWYEKQLFGEDIARLHVLLSPRQPSGSAPWPEGEANSAYFPSVGWAALHDSLADRARVSVYFKSSPYGSLNHSHADQNGFLLYAHGKVLAMDSGYYDYYNSPHWRNWYKQTKAHNAITFDAGKGQGLGADGLGSAQLAGKITRFVTTADYDLVTGDAAAAYDGQVSLAKRTLVFVRPATLVVIDQLRSATPRQWEWNLHTTAPLQTNAAGYKLNLEGAEMCAEVSAPDGLALATQAGYTPAPQWAAATTPHYWNRFFYKTPKPSAYFVAVLRMDCTLPRAQVSFPAGKPVVNLGNRQISLVGTEISVR
ncbi:heparinase II/III family protein [Dechloromonas denitrificans]|uniref:heparinase II/III domain-containing protein n=1 Tax=Dechloromonas denitrificans TaxID=281362 RepID=UPI001CF818F6|nr:heparinase II/III family protein [Dechloromonas denitrificans]UCV05484.1 heparinase II/III family protein [Dechloromonas denitrificans]